jgi:hypothetical protein
MKMNWEQRLREMILAGGALAAAACGDSAATVSEAGTTGAEGGAGSDVGATPDASDRDTGVFTGGFCCNANGDPCCPFLYCDAGISSECVQKMACEADGGTWDFSVQGCSTRDAGTADASNSDAPSDANADVVISPFCCNANADPCCTYLHCGASLTAQCGQELACQADGGTWAFGTGCTIPADAGHTD